MGRGLAFEDVVGLIYEAAVQPDRWPAALEGLGHFCGGTGSHLFLWDRRDNSCPFTVVGGIPTEPQEPYARYYGAIDPRARPLHHMPVCAVLNDAEHFDTAFVERSEFYQDFYIPAGFRWSLSTEFLRAGSLVGLLGVLRDRGREAYGSAEAGCFRRLLPHVRRAVEVQRRMGSVEAERGAMAMALDALATGILFVGTDGRILWANRAAEAILRRNDGLSARGGRLCAALGKDAGRLRQLTERATLDGGGSGGEMLIMRPSGGQPLVLLLTPGPNWAADGLEATALLLITDPAAQRDGLAGTLRRLFALTATEAGVAEEIWHGKRPEEIAEERGVSLATVRSQLHVVLAKTDTRRQAELVRLLASLPARHEASSRFERIAQAATERAERHRHQIVKSHSHSIVPGGFEVTS
jgi:DNA-binding CsgD family transcriptional regulator/PAS domain-containing protein